MGLALNGKHHSNLIPEIYAIAIIVLQFLFKIEAYAVMRMYL